MEISKQQQRDLNIVISLKLREFRKEGIKTISKSQIKDYLFNIKWRNTQIPDTCDFVDDVASIESGQIFEFLSMRAVQNASSMHISDFNDLINK